MVDVSQDRARISSALDAVVERLEVVFNGSGTQRVTGSMRFDPILVGPPGRLHGGLHAYTRTLTLLEWLEIQGVEHLLPIRLDLGLYRKLPLDESVAFSATYTKLGDEYSFASDFAERDKLHAVASRGTGVDSRLAWFADAYRRTRGETPIQTIPAQGDVPMSFYEDVVVAPLDRAMREGGSPSFARYVRPDGSLDAMSICVALDLLAAVTMGFTWRSWSFTARIDLVFESLVVPRGVDVIAMADRRSEPDPDARVRPALLPDGTEASPTKVRVLLAEPSFEHAIAHGTITLVANAGPPLPKHAT